MGVVEFLVAIELVGRHQRALLLLVEDVLHVDEPAPFQVHVHARAQEFLDEHRQVETVGVESSEVAAADELFERPGHLGERRCVLHVFVRDAVHGRRLRGNGHARIEPPGAGDLLAVGHDLDHRNLHDTVTGGVHARGLEVEEDDRTLQVQLHLSLLYALSIIGIRSMSVELVCLSS